MMDEAQAQGLLDAAGVWRPERKDELQPRVYYLNLPKKLIAGTLYDPVEEEVVIGAACTLTAAAGGATRVEETDSYGDFWFEGLEDGVYDLELTHGSQVVAFAVLDTAGRDSNLGDVPLF